MSNNSIFNATVCIMGILIFLIHAVNILIKKKRRRDELCLLDFLLFTVLHFSVYLVFTFLKNDHASNAFVIAFYTAFYIFNNIEAFLLFRYTLSYMEWKEKRKKKLFLVNVVIFFVFVALDLINIFTGIFFGAQGGQYLRSRTMILSQGYQFVTFGVIFYTAVTDRKLNAREKIAFSLYCILPLIAIILQNIFKGYAIAYASILLAAEILFFFISVQRNIALAEEQEKNRESQIRIMMSQIRPHFIYNSLSAISTLIPMDPPQAKSALDAFADYLRLNLSSLTETRLIPFEVELQHIKTYISLEKMRFKDRVNVVYNVWTTDFDVPPLSIQPIVENAIKHGILKKIEGGTVTITVCETPPAYIVKIKDDGVGFDMDEVDFAGNEHIGLNNIRFRIAKMSAGTLTVKSEPGKGTEVTVTFGK